MNSWNYMFNKLHGKLALLYNSTSVYTNSPSCRWDESKTNFPLQEPIYIREYLYNKIQDTKKRITF